MGQFKCEVSDQGSERLIAYLGMTHEDGFVGIKKPIDPKDSSDSYVVYLYSDKKYPLKEFEGNPVEYRTSLGRLYSA